MSNLELVKVLEEYGSLKDLSFGAAWDLLVNAEPEFYAISSDGWNNKTSVVFLTSVTTVTGDVKIVPIIRFENGTTAIWHPSPLDLFDNEWSVFTKQP